MLKKYAKEPEVLDTLEDEPSGDPDG
jgi:hypothetical protein